MAYSHEDLITWDDLAPSLQSLFQRMNIEIGNLNSMSALTAVMENLVQLGQTTTYTSLMTLINANINTTALNNLFNNSEALDDLVLRKDDLVALAQKKTDIIDVTNQKNNIFINKSKSMMISCEL